MTGLRVPTKSTHNADAALDASAYPISQGAINLYILHKLQIMSRLPDSIRKALRNEEKS